jgi:hypothetical protein
MSELSPITHIGRQIRTAEGDTFYIPYAVVSSDLKTAMPERLPDDPADPNGYAAFKASGQKELTIGPVEAFQIDLKTGDKIVLYTYPENQVVEDVAR